MPLTPRRARSMLLAAVAWYAIAVAQAVAQDEPSTVTQRGQVWFGYLTQTRFSQPLSWWNDAHLVPGGFFIVRTGLTVHLPSDLALTGGYAVLGLPMSELPLDLKRPEHRPWAQLLHSATLSDRWRVSNRFRYDARFRRNLGEGMLTSGHTLTHRVRWMASVRHDLPALAMYQSTPYLSVGDELLVNFGPEVARNRVDQNRAFAAVGLSRANVSAQIGYMNRTVVLPSGALVMNHTALVWVFHTIDLRRGPTPFDKPADAE